jgi:protein-disulfide isomerase
MMTRAMNTGRRTGVEKSPGHRLPFTLLLALFLLLAPALSPGLVAGAEAPAAEPSSKGGSAVLTRQQRDEVKRVIREYLLENPEVLDEAITVLQQRQETARTERSKQAIATARQELFGDPTDPIAGNPDGDVTLVEFFDYNCPYCKKARRTLFQILDEDKGVKLVLKEFPILSSDSMLAARAALAARIQGKYIEFHNAMFESKGRLNADKVFAVAGRIGLDIEKLRRDMETPEIGAAIRRNLALARSLDIRGTPAIFIGEHMIPGAPDIKDLKQIIANQRQG